MLHQNCTNLYYFIALFNLQRYEAVKICEMMIGNSFALADYARKNWQMESPIDRSGKSEETAENFL